MKINITSLTIITISLMANSSIAKPLDFEAIGASAIQFISHYSIEKLPKSKMPEDLSKPKKWIPEVTDEDCEGDSRCEDYLKIERLGKEDFAAIRSSYVLEGADLEGLKRRVFNRTLGAITKEILKSRRILNKTKLCSDSSVYLEELIKVCSKSDENNSILQQRHMTWGFCYNVGILGCWRDRRVLKSQEECD